LGHSRLPLASASADLCSLGGDHLCRAGDHGSHPRPGHPVRPGPALRPRHLAARGPRRDRRLFRLGPPHDRAASRPRTVSGAEASTRRTRGGRRRSPSGRAPPAATHPARLEAMQEIAYPPARSRRRGSEASVNIKDHIRGIPDFPKPGILFYDISTLLAHPEAWRVTVDRLAEAIGPHKPDVLAGIESRGFLVAAPLAFALGCGFVMVRKSGKLPGATIPYTYDL